MKTFDDLEFNPHANNPASVQARLDLGNSISISVVAGEGLYGSVETDLYEVGAFQGKEWIPLSCADDVIGWQSPQQISHLMAKLQADNVQDWIKQKIGEKLDWQEENIYTA